MEKNASFVALALRLNGNGENGDGKSTRCALARDSFSAACTAPLNNNPGRTCRKPLGRQEGTRDKAQGTRRTAWSNQTAVGSLCSRQLESEPLPRAQLETQKHSSTLFADDAETRARPLPLRRVYVCLFVVVCLHLGVPERIARNHGVGHPPPTHGVTSSSHITRYGQGPLSSINAQAVFVMRQFRGFMRIE
jgi:hypothetical protein